MIKELATEFMSEIAPAPLFALRYKKGMDPDRMGGGKELGEVECREKNNQNILYEKKIYFSKRKKKEVPKTISVKLFRFKCLHTSLKITLVFLMKNKSALHLLSIGHFKRRDFQTQSY